MRKIHRKLENFFEKITFVITAILRSSITFIVALVTIVFWFSNRNFHTIETNELIRDLIHGIAFLSLFVIQKEFNKFSGALHLKVNELVASNETANNAVINVESKTETEIHELQKEYTELAEKIEKEEDKL
jgi:low affinity Fe/Cu permease